MVELTSWVRRTTFAFLNGVQGLHIYDFESAAYFSPFVYSIHATHC